MEASLELAFESNLPCVFCYFYGLGSFDLPFVLLSMTYISS